MRDRLDRLARRLVRNGVRRGVVEGNDLWLALGALALLYRVLSKKDAPLRATERLALGESIVVTHVPADPTRRQLRKATRSGTSAPASGA
jgi:hypothetical protein